MPALPSELNLPDGPLDLSLFSGHWPEDLLPRWLQRTQGWVRLYALSPEQYDNLREELHERQATHLPFLPPVHLHQYQGGALVWAESAAPEQRLALPDVHQDESVLLSRLLTLGTRLADLLSGLHRAGFLWTSFDPSALESTAQGLRIRNLDLLLPRVGRPLHHLDAVAAYAAPERMAFAHERLCPATDVFSLAVLIYYLLMGRPEGFPGQGPAAFDYDFPPLRIYRPRLPLGIEPVLRRALHPDPLLRYPTPTAFLRAFQNALAQISTRQQVSIPVALDVAGDSRIGRFHQVTNTPNQDRFLILPLGEQLVLAVADGVTHALIGSGDLASETAIASFTQTFQQHLASGTEMRSSQARTALLTQAFEQASRDIFQRALAEPLGRFATDPCDLMSSTALVGWLQGRHLILGNLGDSRAYLVRHGMVEQLTVDGDLRTLYLSQGIAPEEVNALGPMVASLYRCLGVAYATKDAQLALDLQRCVPDLSEWFLLPGDTVILCSDGLVEEGVFLSAEHLPALVQGGTAAEAVQRLIEAACALHRDPSPAEPEGCGDDVTCIVIRVLPADATPL